MKNIITQTVGVWSKIRYALDPKLGGLIAMVRSLLSGIGVAAMIAGAMPASASVLTFDDLGAGPNFFTSDYQGFSFGTNDIATTAWFHTDESSSFYKPQSGSVFIATDSQLYLGSLSQATQAITRSTAFAFDGAYFSGDSTISYQLSLNGAVVFTSTPSASLSATPTLVASGYSGAVDSVVVIGHQGFYGLDDFTYHAVGPAESSVPEPATWAMFIGGFGLVGSAMRRRKVAVSFA